MSSATRSVVYIGPHDSVSVEPRHPDTGLPTGEAWLVEQGKPAELPADVAKGLLEQDTWVEARSGSHMKNVGTNAPNEPPEGRWLKQADAADRLSDEAEAGLEAAKDAASGKDGE